MNIGHRPSIAILGSRGIPAEFGGFETFAEQLAVRLAQRGWNVTVFCEPSQSYKEPSYKGVRLEYLYTPRITGLRSVWFDVVSIFRTLLGYDVVYMLGYHAAFAFFLPRLLGTKFWVNMDGLEWKRSKWSKAAQQYLRLMEWLAVKWATRLIADAQGIADYLTISYGCYRKVTVIPYGAYVVERAPSSRALMEYGVEADGYYLVVCRLEPENHVVEILEGFSASSSKRELIVVGDDTVTTPHVRSLLAISDPRIRFVGTIFDSEKLTALRYYCHAYLHGHSVGGTNPSLLEAMACGNFIVAHDNTFNREVTRERATYFSSISQLTDIINNCDNDATLADRRAFFRELVKTHYNWDSIAQAYAQALTS